MDAWFTEFVSGFHFLRPAWLLALVPAAVLFLLMRLLHGRRTAWTRAIEPELLPYLLDTSASSRRNFPLYGLLLIWVLSTVALAGPVWQRILMPVQEREDALVLVMDLSLSMYADDLSPNRVVRARRKLVDILNTREEGLTALVVYAGDAHAVTPLTDDVATILNLIPALDPAIMPVMGSRPETGVRLGLELVDNAALERARILLVTDGVEEQDIPAVAGLLAGTGHSLSVLGMGTENGAPIVMPDGGFLRDTANAIVIPKLPRERLRTLAAAAGGRYADAQLTDDDIDYLLDERFFARDENLIESEREFDTWNEAGPWLLLLVLPLAALAFRRGWLLSMAFLALLPVEKQALALEWQDIWVTKDQQGSWEFEGEDYEQAARLFDDPRWRASANFRSGNYAGAVQDLAPLDDAEAHYNRGNALARLNRLEDAVAAYEQALARQPDHEDALYNKKILEDLLEQQENQRQNQQPQTGGDQNDQQDQQQNGQQQNQQGQQNTDGGQQDQQQAGQQQDQQNNPDNQDAQDQQNGQEGEQDRQQSQDLPQLAQGEQSEGDSEEEQSMQQWLRRIPDDPAELLRNKFQYQSRQRLLQQLQDPNRPQPPAERPW